MVNTMYLTLCPFYIHLDDDGVLLDDFQKLLKLNQ
jgi:hypothetical protein